MGILTEVLYQLRLECTTPDQVDWVWVLAGDIVLCSWARHFTLTVPLSTQVYKWVPANAGGKTKTTACKPHPLFARIFFLFPDYLGACNRLLGT